MNVEQIFFTTIYKWCSGFSWLCYFLLTTDMPSTSRFITMHSKLNGRKSVKLS